MDKNIILLSGESDVFIENSNNHFQNKLWTHYYLDSESLYSITPKLLLLDLQFINPACAENEDHPAFIACSLNRIKKVWDSINQNKKYGQ